MPVYLERIFAILLSVFTFITHLTGSTGNAFIEKVEKFRVTSYVVASTVQDPAELHSEDFDIITNAILFGCATFDENGNVNVDTPVLEKALTNLRNVIGTRDVEISLNILGPKVNGDYDDWYEQMDAQSKLYTKAFQSGVLENNIVALLNKYDFDCVHFDYEYPITAEAWKSFNAFLVSLDAKLGNIKLGIAVSDWDIKLTTNGVAAVDYFELMLYDIYDDMGRHSTYDTAVEVSHKSGLSGLPHDKVNFGVPFYARPTDTSAYWYDYAPYAKKIDSRGYFYDKTIEKRFWFNTPDVIEKKTNYAIENGFGGVMIWHYACDLPSSNSLSLLGAINKSVKNNYA